MSRSMFMTLATTLALSSFLSAPAMAKDFKSSDDFAKQATISGLFEIKSSELALTKSKDEQVRALAKQMIADHTKANEELKAALKTSKMDITMLPSALDDAHQKVYDSLVNSSDLNFDDQYMEAQDDAHEEAIALFKSYIDKGDSTALKQFAEKTLPTLQMHEKHVEQVDDDIDDDTND